MLLAALSTSAADDLFLDTRWRGLWLTEQMQSIITSEAMLDPAVSLGMLRLVTQLALAGSDDKKVVSIRESFNARMAGMAPRSWFVALGQNLLTAATGTDATTNERQAAVEHLRLLTKQLPDSAELRLSLEEALSKLAQWGEAEPLYQRALAIREEALGHEHLDVAISLENYAVVLRNMCRSDEAEPLGARARAIRAN
jgi:tetratricopeptide (TPR) repeat protein